jgi:phosphatidate cytidylyltransferase
VKRILTALVLLPLFIGAVLVPNPLVFGALVMVASVLCAAEMERIGAASGIVPFPFLGSVWAACFLFGAMWPEVFPLDAVLAGGALALVGFGLWGRVPLAGVLASSALACFTALYTGYLLGFMILVRKLGEPLGARLIFLGAIVVWAGDTAAYYVGSTIGRHKLAPQVSPGKTWEGAVANVAGGLVGASAVKLTFFADLEWRHAIALGLVLSVVGQLGDLFESALKRGAGVKDSGSILPGHGGFLDRLDSLVVNGPVLYFYHQVFMT